MFLHMSVPMEWLCNGVVSAHMLKSNGMQTDHGVISVMCESPSVETGKHGTNPRTPPYALILSLTASLQYSR
jgi:hypothetical protein